MIPFDDVIMAGKVTQEDVGKIDWFRITMKHDKVWTRGPFLFTCFDFYPSMDQ